MGDATTHITSMIRCPDCDRSVPEANLSIHQATACGGRARGAESSPNVDDPMDIDQDVVEIPAGTSPAVARSVEPSAPYDELHNDERAQRRRHRRDRDRHRGRHRKSPRSPDTPLTATTTSTASTASTASPSAPSTSNDVVDLCSPSSGEGGRNEDDNTIVDLSQDDTPPSASTGDEWACPQCTLFNPTLIARCEACNFRNPDRPPDPVRRERLVGGNDLDSLFFGNNHMNSYGSEDRNNSSYVGGGAFLGGLLGGAGAYMRGRPLGNGLLEGAVTGAASGAVMDQLLRTSPSSSSGPTSVASARSGAAMGHPSYPSASLSNNQQGRDDTPTPRRRARPRSSFRLRHEPNGVGQRTIRTRSGSQRAESFPVGIDDPMMAALVGHLLSRHSGHAGGGNIDGMSYEQLLQAFGDGSENRGAEETTISVLPTTKLTDVERELPADARQCLICLEDFQPGEVRKTLPCLHGFHDDCADKWLRTNATCPICKHSVSS